MRRIQYFYNVPESETDCMETDCDNCEHMRELLMENTECQECFNEEKKEEYRRREDLSI